MSKDAIKLADGQEYEIPKISPLAKSCEDVRSQLMNLQKLFSGQQAGGVQRKIQRDASGIARLEKMVERADAFITHPDSSKEDREKYFGMIEKYEADIREREAAIDAALKEATDTAASIARDSNEVAVWLLQREPNNLSLEKAQDIVTQDAAIEIVLRTLGLYKDPEKGEAKELPLAQPKTSENTSG